MSALDALLRCFADDGVCIRDIYANELAEARAELAALRSELADWRDGAKQAAGEMCGDEKHCTCVPALRSAVESARAEERERCARIADDHLNDERKALNAGGYIEACMQIAAAIRATGKAAETRT